MSDYEILDDRPPVCPNGCGLLAPVNEQFIECPACKYHRKVLADD